MMENDKDDKKFTFDSLKNMVILALKLNKLQESKDNHAKLLKMSSKKTRNEANDALNYVLDTASKGFDSSVVEDCFERTLT